MNHHDFNLGQDGFYEEHPYEYENEHNDDEEDYNRNEEEEEDNYDEEENEEEEEIHRQGLRMNEPQEAPNVNIPVHAEGEQNLHNEDDDEDDEEEEEEDDHDNDEEEQEEENQNNLMMEPGILDGGNVLDDVPLSESQLRRGPENPHGSNAAVSLIFEFMDDFPTSRIGSDHPVYKRGSVVKITMEKTTKLSLVFARYCNFAHSLTPSSADKKHNSNSNHHAKKNKITPDELEFSHCSILDSSDTVESSALMKEDRIFVKRDRMVERKMYSEGVREQRESDRKYFEQLRGLLPEFQPKWCKCDVVFHCKGKIKDDKGYQQKVLTTYVKGNSAILMKRCPWLKTRIEVALWERNQRHREQDLIRPNGIHGDDDDDDDDDDTVNDVNAVDAYHNAENENQIERRIVEAEQSDVDDDINHHNGHSIPFHHDEGQNDNERVLRPADSMNDDDHNVQPGGHIRQGAENIHPPPQQQRRGNAVVLDEEEEDMNDDDENNNNFEPPHQRRRLHNIQDVSADDASETEQIPNALPVGLHDNPSPLVIPYVGGNFPDTLRVTLMHPPEAVKLLLEYCYTNRVVSLGSEAFYKSYIPVDAHTLDSLLLTLSGPVSPYQTSNDMRGVRSSWPNEGEPTVSFEVALAGIQLAEEANIPRLSLMCEIAASQLVSPNTALEALIACQQQVKASGNPLKILRKTVMLHHLLARGSEGVHDFVATPSFNRTLHEKRDVVIPSLLTGINETMKSVHEHQWSYYDKIHAMQKLNTQEHNNSLDKHDVLHRIQERLKRRKERWNKRARDNQEINPYQLPDDGPYESTQLNKLLLHDNLVGGVHFIYNPLRSQKVPRSSKHRRRKSKSGVTNAIRL